MELKNYQKKTLGELKRFIAGVKGRVPAEAARLAFYMQTDKAYNLLPEVGNSPFVCIKVPTAGGKTLIAVHAVGLLFKEYFKEREDTGLVMWFVPSDAIKTQTLNNLKNKNHPYREALDKRFDGAVKIFDLTEAKAIKRDDLADNLCIIVSTLSAFRRNDREWLKVYQDNGALMDHFDGLDLKKADFLKRSKNGEVVYSLSNVIKLHSPLVIADEGHNVQTPLAYEMLKDLNPAFVLEFTATPKGKSNVLVSIAANELKKENMIKMPVFLANKVPWNETITEGILKLRELDKIAAKNKKDYIRPIMLIQAEREQEYPRRVHVKQIYDFLVSKECKISPEEIAIQTSKTKQLPATEILLNKVCKIRFIITVNALREGWDCPFAYVLVSVSNLGARLSVEQTIGRIMRLPYAKRYADDALNSAYVFAATRNFRQASEIVIKGLEGNGYEDIIRTAEGVSVGAGEYKRVIKDKTARLPFLNIKDGSTLRRLDYVSDLIDDIPVLKNAKADIALSITDDNQVIKIDVTREGGLVRDAAGRLGLTYHHRDFQKEDLVNWFREKIQRGFISIDEVTGYLERALIGLLKKHLLASLSMHRYQVKEAIERRIDELVEETSTKKFKDLEARKRLCAKGEEYILPEMIKFALVSQERFTKHLYERVGKMNGEETDFAFQIDSIKNISWWCRNPENDGFYIQGWHKDKFRPDFIVKTKKGNYFVLEYKGEYLERGEDAVYKEKIGKIWEELSDKKYYFILFGASEVNAVLERISKF